MKRSFAEALAEVQEKDKNEQGKDDKGKDKDEKGKDEKGKDEKGKDEKGKDEKDYGKPKDHMNKIKIKIQSKCHKIIFK